MKIVGTKNLKYEIPLVVNVHKLYLFFENIYFLLTLHQFLYFKLIETHNVVDKIIWPYQFNKSNKFEFYVYKKIKFLAY